MNGIVLKHLRKHYASGMKYKTLIFLISVVEADFNTTSFNVTFPADEGRIPITSVDVRVSIVDDNINERFEQLFLIGAEVVEATNPSTIDNSQRNVSIGIIDDNDGEFYYYWSQQIYCITAFTALEVFISFLLTIFQFFVSTCFHSISLLSELEDYC